jgi:molybdopterin biosynthesis enzyme MoaB
MGATLDKQRMQRRHVPTAVLSRQTAGLRGKSLILNLPGKPKAIRETIDEVGSTMHLPGPFHDLLLLHF